jgi:hypothetical protein
LPPPNSRRRSAAAANLASRDVETGGGRRAPYAGVLATSPLVAVARPSDIRAVVAPTPFDPDNEVSRPRKRRSSSATSRAVPTGNEDPVVAAVQLRWQAVLEWEVRHARNSRVINALCATSSRATCGALSNSLAPQKSLLPGDDSHATRDAIAERYGIIGRTTDEWARRTNSEGDLTRHRASGAERSVYMVCIAYAHCAKWTVALLRSTGARHRATPRPDVDLARPRQQLAQCLPYKCRNARRGAHANCNHAT